jgi:hypothetical protein
MKTKWIRMLPWWINQNRKAKMVPVETVEFLFQGGVSLALASDCLKHFIHLFLTDIGF